MAAASAIWPSCHRGNWPDWEFITPTDDDGDDDRQRESFTAVTHFSSHCSVNELPEEVEVEKEQEEEEVESQHFLQGRGSFAALPLFDRDRA